MIGPSPVNGSRAFATSSKFISFPADRLRAFEEPNSAGNDYENAGP